MKHSIHDRIFTLACLAGIACFAPQTSAQQDVANLPDNPSPEGSPSQVSAPAERETTWRTLPRDFLHDQKDIWLFPVQLAKGHHWIPTLIVAGGTAAFIAADPHVASYRQIE